MILMIGIRQGQVFRGQIRILVETGEQICPCAPCVEVTFYYTCYYNVYRFVKQKPVDMLNYHEFYSEDLFTLIKDVLRQSLK